MVHRHRTLLAQFLWTVLLLAGTTSRLPAQEQTLGSESEGDQSQATTAEVVSLPGITGKATPTAELQAPDLERLLTHLEAFRKAHTPFHIRHREVIKLRNASEVKALESMGLPPGMLLDTEYESAFWDNRSWRRCLSLGVDGEQASDKRSKGDREGTAGLDVPFALLGVFIEPKPENCKLTFDDIFPHITTTSDEHKDHIELWMFPVSGHWIPKRLRITPEDKEEPVVDWEVHHIEVFGKDRPPQIIDGEGRWTVRNSEQQTTITSEFFITKALYGDDVVPGEIDASLMPIPAPPAQAANHPGTEVGNELPAIIIDTAYSDIDRSQIIRELVEALEQEGLCKREKFNHSTERLFRSALLHHDPRTSIDNVIHLVRTLKSQGVQRMIVREDRESGSSSIFVNCPAGTSQQDVNAIRASLEKIGGFGFDVFVDNESAPREIESSLASAPVAAVVAPGPAQEVQTRIPDGQEKTLTPIVPTMEPAPDNAARVDKPITDPSGDQSTSNSGPLAVRILDGREDREFLGQLEGLQAEGIIAVCDDPTATGDIILTIDGPPLMDSKQFQDLLRGISQLRLPSCLVYVKPQPRTDPRQDSVVQISTRPEVSFADVARVVDLVKSKPRIAFLLRQSEAAPPQTKTEELRVLALKHVRASEAARVVEQMYEKALSVAVAERTNSLIVRGTRPAVEEAAALLERLDRQVPKTEPVNSSARGDGTGHRVNVPALGPDPLAVDSSVQVRGDGQAFTFSLGFSGQSADDLQRQYDALEQRAQSLSDQLRKPLPDPATGETLRSQLRDTVRQSFETRQNLQRAELAEFAKRLQSIRQSIEMREQISQQIIDRRVQELLDPNLKWETSEANSGRAQALRSASPDSSVGVSSRFGAARDTTAGETQTVQIKFDSRKLGKVEWLSEPGSVRVDGFGDGRINAKYGERIRMRLSDLPGREDAIVFLSLEVSDDPEVELQRHEVVNPSAVLSRNAVPLEVTSDDLDQVISGNLVTKVIYLPHVLKSEALFETLVSTRLEPNVNIFELAREKGGTVAIVRMSNRPSSGNAALEIRPVPNETLTWNLMPRQRSHTIGKLVLVFFQDKSRRAVPCVPVRTRNESFVITMGPATVVPDGTPHAIDRCFVEWDGSAPIEVVYDDRSTEEFSLYRLVTDSQLPESVQVIPGTAPAENAELQGGFDPRLEIGAPLTALTMGAQAKFSETSVHVTAVNVMQNFRLATHNVDRNYKALFAVDAALPEGTPIFHDGELMGLTILGSRFIGEEAGRSFVVPATRLREFCHTLQNTENRTLKNENP